MDGQERPFDVILAAALLAACEVELFVNIHRHGLRSGAPSYVDAALLAGVMVPIIARRRAPLIVTLTSFASLFVLSEVYSGFDSLVVPQLVLFVLPYAVAAYITAAYWFTCSTSFANPAVTVARAASDTFAGIRPADAPGFVAAQIVGAAAATLLFRWLVPQTPAVQPYAVAPQSAPQEKQ